MSVPPDPPRLLDTGSSSSDALRNMLAAGRMDGPDPDQIARIAARAAGLASPPGGPSGGGSAGSLRPPAWSFPAAKVGLAVIALGIAGGGYALHRASTRAAHDAPVVAVAAVPAPSAAAPPDRSIAGGAGAPIEPLPAVSSAAPAVPAARPSAPARRADPSPSAAPSAGAGTGAAAPPAGAVSEIELVDRAQRALASSPATALSLADEHAARFAGGALAPEREVIAISALAAMGRKGEARARADRFRAAYPGSAYLRRIDVVLSKSE